MLDRWIPKEKRDTRKNASSGNGASSDNAASGNGASSAVDDTQKSSSKSAKADTADIKEMYIPGVDTAKGIALTGGVFETYKQLLFMLSKDIDERLQFFRKELTTDNLPDFVTHVHSLKSASASIGAGEISSLAAGLEAIGKAGDAAFIRESLPDFTKKLEELKKDILSGLTQISIV